MRRSIAAVMTMFAATAVGAQNPAPGAAPGRVMVAGPMGGGARSAQLFLSRSAELELTDAQVVKLAGIARKAEARQKALRAQMDSGRGRFTQPGDSVARRAFMTKMRDNATKERAASQTDLRDALAVLTPDQQAKAWQMNARRGAVRGMVRGGMGRARPGGMRPGGMRPGGVRQILPRGAAPEERRRMFPDDMGPGGGVPGARQRMVRPRPPVDDAIPGLE